MTEANHTPIAALQEAEHHQACVLSHLLRINEHNGASAVLSAAVRELIGRARGLHDSIRALSEAVEYDAQGGGQ